MLARPAPQEWGRVRAATSAAQTVFCPRCARFTKLPRDRARVPLEARRPSPTATNRFQSSVVAQYGSARPADREVGFVALYMRVPVPNVSGSYHWVRVCVPHRLSRPTNGELPSRIHAQKTPPTVVRRIENTRRKGGDRKKKILTLGARIYT